MYSFNTAADVCSAVARADVVPCLIAADESTVNVLPLLQLVILILFLQVVVLLLFLKLIRLLLLPELMFLLHLLQLLIRFLLCAILDSHAFLAADPHPAAVVNLSAFATYPSIVTANLRDAML